MKYALIATPGFKRQFKRLVKNNRLLQRKIDQVSLLLQSDPFAPSLKSHRVGADEIYNDIWSSRITKNIRIIWTFDEYENLVIIFIRIGGHDDVY